MMYMCVYVCIYIYIYMYTHVAKVSAWWAEQRGSQMER